MKNFITLFAAAIILAVLFGCPADTNNPPQPETSSTTSSTTTSSTSTTIEQLVTTTTLPLSWSSDQTAPAIPNICMNVMPIGSTISFSSATNGADVYLCVSDHSINMPENTIIWKKLDSVTLDQSGDWHIYSKATHSDFSDSPIIEMTVNVVSSFDSTTQSSIDKSVPTKWATGYKDYVIGTYCTSESFQDPQKALGAAKGDSYDIVCLGNGGSITLSFDIPICDGKGADFAVFENGFNNQFLELGFVSVSSDGEHFIRFDCVSLTDHTVDAFGSIDNTQIYNLASKYKQGLGTPFDLNELRYRSEVLSGLVDLNRIRYIRIDDIIGDPKGGRDERDSFGNIIYDPYTVDPSIYSAGFDLDAIGVLNVSDAD